LNHPYKSYENTDLWNTIKKGILDLVENNDLELNTPIEYIVGYLCERLTKNSQ